MTDAPGAPGVGFTVDPSLTGTAAPADRCVAVQEGRLLLTPAGELPTLTDLGDGPVEALGVLDGAALWLVDPARPSAELVRCGWASLAAQLGPAAAAAAAHALHLIDWRRRHRYCGQCAADLQDVPDQPARRCTRCERTFYHQLSPAVLVGIERADELLLVRHSYGPAGLWALVAGFVEAGESLEDAVRREVFEEVGLRVTDLRYVDSQGWAMSGPDGLLVGFRARCDGGEVRVDGRELTEARWFRHDELPAELPPAYSLSRWLIDAFSARHSA